MPITKGSQLLRPIVALLLGGVLWGSALVASAEGYQLDMRNAQLRDFINTVAKLTEKTIVIDPRVSGVVDIQSHRELSPDELYEVFLVQLSVHGYAVVDLGNGILKVIPAQGARVEGNTVSSEGVADASEAIVTRMIQVNNVDVAKLVPVLRPMINNQTGLIESFGQANVLLVTDKESNVKRLLEIVRKLDKADSRAFEIVELKNASAQEMRDILKDIVQQMGQSQEGNSAPTIAADLRTNSVLIRGDATDRAYLKQVIRKLDGEVQTSANTRVIYLRYAKAKDLVEVLDSVSESILKGTGGNGSKEQERSSLSIKAHEQTNSLILSGSPTLIRSMETVIRKLDIRRAQVLVEAIIVELSESRSKQLGVDWLFRGATSESIVPFGTINNSGGTSSAATVGKALISGTDSELLDSLSGIQGVGAGLGKFSAGSLSFSALLIALTSDSDTNVLSTPSLLTMDNEEASILVGQEVPVITGSTAGDNNDNPFQTITRQDVGVTLKVKPQINEGNAVQLSIYQEVSSLSGLTASDIITNKREITTTVLVDDGDVIVLGGLIDDDVQESASKVPVLGDLPGLGRVFRTDKARRTKRNLMVFIRPVIIRDASTLQEISHEKYRYIKARQLSHSQNGVTKFDNKEGPALDVLDVWGVQDRSGRGDL